MVEEYDIPNNLQGAVVLEVVPGAPAAQGGLRNPTQRSVDIITAINNSPIERYGQLAGIPSKQHFAPMTALWRLSTATAKP
ncbi:MAG UNVERIFIED_CONTAM: hypothetical protein LVT10_24905 [Anaerolineae bacterium]